MKFERLRALRATAFALTVCAVSGACPIPSAAQSPNDSRTSKAVSIRARAGTCPKAFTLLTRTRAYEGGAEFQLTAQTAAFAVAPRMVSSKPHRVEFLSTTLRPPFSTCEATVRVSGDGSACALTLHDGTLRVVFDLSREQQVVKTSVAGGNPVITSAVAD
jgi:hypothetical protein